MKLVSGVKKNSLLKNLRKLSIYSTKWNISVLGVSTNTTKNTKMKKITIQVNKNNFRLIMVGKRRNYKSAGGVIGVLERLLTHDSRLEKKERTALKVDYGQGYTNESLGSKNPYYLLFSILCFLEDYLNQEYFSVKEKLYLKKGGDEV